MINSNSPMTVEEHLKNVDYAYINNQYIASSFAFKYVQFVKNIVNDGKGDSNLTPPVHLKMLDQLQGKGTHYVNLAFRGSAKTSLFAEYLFLYIAVFGGIDGFGKVTGAIFMGDSMENGVKNFRKNIETRFNNSKTIQNYIDKAVFTDNSIEFQNVSKHRFGIKMFGAQTNLRGVKIFAKRPQLAVLDDLIKEGEENSKAALERINTAVYAGLDYSLDPNKKKVILNGTPFNKQDIIYQAVESGAWIPNVFPICEKFPCDRSEFHGAWEDRFNYDYVNRAYEFAKAAGKLSEFNRELMLNIVNDDEKLITSNMLQYYSKSSLLFNKNKFNYYITTDFAVSKKQRSDYSVILVWAVDDKENIYLVDGYCERSEMDVNIDKLFEFAAKYAPMEVGIEISGQQKGFVNWIQKEQLRRECMFNFGASTRGTPGISSTTDKLSRFKRIYPSFATNKIYLPKEDINENYMIELLEELNSITNSGMVSKHDDVNDAISMLSSLNILASNYVVEKTFNADHNIWLHSQNIVENYFEEVDELYARLNSYVN